MKNFFTSLLGALAALIIFCGGSLLLVCGVVGALAALNQKAPRVEKGSYLVFDLSANITDAPPQFDPGQIMAPFTGNQAPPTLQLRDVTRALRAAAHDNRIAGLYLTGQIWPTGYGSGLGALQEVRAALEDFRASGKPIVAYLSFATTRDYYLASTASELVLDPFGEIDMPGLAVEPLYMAGAFEKFGIGVQVTRVGKYKSYVEPYIRQNMSPADREQTQKLLGDLWTNLVDSVARSRHLTPAQVQAVADNDGFITAPQAERSGLVDRVAYLDQVLAQLKKSTGVTDPKEAFKQVDLADYATTLRADGPAKGGSGRIAVVYAEGDIVDGAGNIGEIGGDDFARELRKLRQDDSVKAIVLRVNSPGGSASAAETIQREIRLAMQVKPVIVSMGSYAASGGYWISTYADRIFAEPNTITGSIGVFGLFFNVQKLANDYGFTWDSVKTGKLAGMLTISRPKTPAELAVFQNQVDWIYGQFIARVAASRHLAPEDVEEIAQGRVWSGAEAKQLGLVDQIGGLRDAIQYAARKAGLGSRFRITEYPRRKEFSEMLADWIQGVNPAQSRDQGALNRLFGEVRQQAGLLTRFNDPRGVYARLPVELSVK